MTLRIAPAFLSLIAFGMAACAEGASDSASGGGAGGQAGGTGGAGAAAPTGGTGAFAPTGGTGAVSPTGGTGGTTGGAGGSGASGSCEPGNAGLDPTSFPECPTCMGEAAHCVPTSVVEQTAPGQAAQLASCDAENVCVPDVLISTLGNYAPPTCTSVAGGIGRCLSICIQAVADMESFLPQDTCPQGELCAPCSDPRTGASTGACTLSCDNGPTEPAAVFDKCCEGDIGICVPPDLVDETQAAALGQQTCDAGTLCAPEVLADATYIPPTCTSVGGAEGRCLSTCVSMVGDQAELLPQDTCPTGELCAPCTDPRSGELTGACSINGDAPTEPPVVFESECCGGTGLCVPDDAVPAKYASLVPPDTCATSEGEGWLCAPKLKLEDLDAPFEPCAPVLPGPTDPNGACVPQCITDAQIAANPVLALGLAPQTCPSGYICAPCENPLDGTRTGACD